MRSIIWPCSPGAWVVGNSYTPFTGQASSPGALSSKAMSVLHNLIIFLALSHVPATTVGCNNNVSSSSSNNSSGTLGSEIVPYHVGDVLAQQVVTRKRANSKAAGKEKKARRFGEWEDDPELARVAKRRPPSEAAVDRAAELQAAQRRAQWLGGTNLTSEGVGLHPG